jgi:hypothetical protein
MRRCFSALPNSRFNRRNRVAHISRDQRGRRAQGGQRYRCPVGAEPVRQLQFGAVRGQVVRDEVMIDDGSARAF